MDNKPVLLLVGGGWHVPESYIKLTNALTAAGLDVHCPRYASMRQIRPPTAGLAQDSEDMRDYVAKLVEEGRRVIVLGHSYGGQVMTNSLCGLGIDARKEKGLPGGVSDLIYLAAFALEEGRSMNDKVKEMGHEELMPIAFNFADDMTVLAGDPRNQLVGEHSDEKEVEEYLGTLMRWNGQSMYDGIERCAWREIPATYIYTVNDMTVPFDYQKSMVASMESAGRKVKTYELVTGHCPNLTATKDVVDICEAVVKGQH